MDPLAAATPERAGATARGFLVRIWNYLRRIPDLLLMRRKLLIVDDYFPNLLTSFRVSEFNDYLKQFPQAHVISYSETFDQDFAAYRALYPQFADRVSPAGDFQAVAGRLAYCVFINNARRQLENFERFDTPFIFTLYPGGGLGLDNEQSDTWLRRVCGSPGFRGVIVTQAIMRDYLLNKGICAASQIEFIYGGVFPATYWIASRVARQRYGEGKDTLDICFVAFKYSAGGVDKGYDRFLAAARILISRVSDVRFHVVGGFDETELPVADIRESLTFYGPQVRSFFPDFYSRMDIIVSPNIPDAAITQGAFDGFPTGCCIEAALSGTAVFCTDVLGLNCKFADHQEIEIVPIDPQAIAATVAAYRSEPDSLRKLGEQGQRAFCEVFSDASQLEPRRALLRRHINEPLRPLLRLLGRRPRLR